MNDAIISRFRDHYAETQAEYAAAQKRAKETNLNAAAAVSARELVQTTAQAVQERVHGTIAGLVTHCLAAVFDDPYTFGIEFTKKRGKTEAELYFERGGHRFNYAQVGGGVLDVAAFALRLACLLLRRPAVRRLMVLDEPVKHLSERGGNLDRFRDLLLSLAQELDFQFIVVTHNHKLEIGQTVQIG